MLQDSLSAIINNIILVITVLISVAFLTLLERKVLGYIQIRKGPNKVGWAGLPQPFADAIKLFTKETTTPTVSNLFIYNMTPAVSMFLALILWSLLPLFYGLHNFNLGFLFFLCCTSLGVYTVLLCGWSSNSKYSMLGGLRCVAQTISYEVSLALILISFLIMSSSFSVLDLSLVQINFIFALLSAPLAAMWFASSLAETNRTPFDLAEGESELVSGFNIEYSSGGFALIFMAEYSSILFMSALFSLMFLGPTCSFWDLPFKTGLVAFSFIWARGTLPRFRYDKLMALTWKSFLPVALSYIVTMMTLSMF
uniref:NADH-ubiquinone oxidoreductase chain 1 n=1 Tax=Takobia yixiani TaxID=743459 RepID=X1W3E2_9INSE|nr:NADH dehydrogenase subunit 1 [Takobia yixiani]